VLLGDRDLTMPARLTAALEVVRAAGTFRPADLAGHLDEQSRLVVCRRLVREGLLEVLR
jgi:bifunctional lysine-specific demethylase and histidyl-hydroxylase NO66